MALTALPRLLRWPGAATAAGNTIASFLLAHRPESPGGRTAALGACLGAILVYSGGVVLNDVADADRDRGEHPSRPIPSGDVSRGAGAWFGAVLLVAGIAAAWIFAGQGAGIATAAAAACATLYDFGARFLRVTGILALGAARAANAVAGAAAATGSLAFLDDASHPSRNFAIALAAYTAVLTWTSTFENRALPRWGPAFFAVALGVTAMCPWALFPAITWPGAPAIAFVLLALTLVIGARGALDQARPGPHGASPQLALGLLVRAGVFGFLLLDAAWLLGSGRYDAGLWWLVLYLTMRFATSRARS